MYLKVFIFLEFKDNCQFGLKTANSLISEKGSCTRLISLSLSLALVPLVLGHTRQLSKLSDGPLARTQHNCIAYFGAPTKLPLGRRKGRKVVGGGAGLGWEGAKF